MDWAGFKLSSECPKHKDWNDDLIAVVQRLSAPKFKNLLSQAMNNDPHDSVLDDYFWDFVDRGDAPADTPLFTGIQGGEPLAVIIAREFGLPPHEAESAIEIARKEVAL